MLGAAHVATLDTHADLTTPDGLERVVDRIGDGDIDLVVNNAGFGTSGDFHDQDPDRVAAEVDLNVGALTRLSHAALSVMVPRGSGWLLNVSSIASFQPAPGLAVYAATKAYVTSLSESLHEGEGSQRSILRVSLPAQTVSTGDYAQFARFCQAVDELATRPPRLERVAD